MNRDIASQKPLFHRPWLRRASWGLFGLLLLWLLGWLALPPLIKTQLQSRLGEQLGRAVTVGRVDFKPWTLELTLSDVAVAHQADASAQLAFQRLYIDVELQSLLRLAPVVDALRLEGLRVNLTHAGDGHYDVDDVLARLAAQPSQPASSPLRYALYNLVIADATLVLTDVPRKSVHRVSQLNLSVPFLSNLDSKREVQVSPKLAFDLNGSRFDSTAAATPFGQTRQADARLVIQHLDLAPYLPYWPAYLPVRLQSGVLDADLTVSFEQRDSPLVTLGGQISANGVRVAQARPVGATGQGGTAELLSFDRLTLTLDDVQPLVQKVGLRRVEWVQPRLLLHRNKSGVLNVQTLARAQTGTKTAAEPEPASPWQVRVQELAVSGGEVQWMDEAAARPARLSLDALAFNAHAISWPFEQPAGFDGAAQIAGASLSFKGEATDAQANVNVQLNRLPLSAAAPYLAGVLTPRLGGVLSTDLALRWVAAQAGQAGQTQLKVASLTVDKLDL